ncbi:MAG TPA: GPW/gp25 family protein [Bryobacteraceae bacterium]|jgi:phage baseplate assembly protein W|nr:GPW/gp25 family protein [Bryobacteraceae bacterium]
MAPSPSTSPYRDPISWPFLPKPAGGVMTYATLEQSVRDSIRIILTTRPGEQLMTPYFGAGLQNYLDEGNTLAVRRQIQTTIQSALQQYENRITVDAVEVNPIDGAPSEINVQIHYRVIRTNTPGQVGVTMQAG